MVDFGLLSEREWAVLWQQLALWYEKINIR